MQGLKELDLPQLVVSTGDVQLIARMTSPDGEITEVELASMYGLVAIKGFLLAHLPLEPVEVNHLDETTIKNLLLE